jgi:aryl-alcohol dehydrogenase-like predicted oxidoreductase
MTKANLMRYKLLGQSGLRVSELALGTMAFGEDWGWGAAKDECGRILTAFREAGGNFVDTANAYTNGSAERFLGELLGTGRDEVVLATKYTASTDPRDPNASGNHRKSLLRALDASLERLHTDYVDLLWVHIWDFLTPIEEVMRALDDQVRAGKVLYLGISDTPAWIIARANTLAEQRGWTPFVAAQAQYSLVERTIERDLLPMSQALDLAVTAWSPLGMGVLTGKYGDGRASDGDARLNVDAGGRSLLAPRNLEIAREVGRVADEIGASPAQVAIAWLRARPGVVVPIVGARREAQLRDNLGALGVVLGADQLTRLDEVSRVDLGFPSEFISAQLAGAFVLGETGSRIDDHRALRSGLPLSRHTSVTEQAR